MQLNRLPSNTVLTSKKRVFANFSMLLVFKPGLFSTFLHNSISMISMVYIFLFFFVYQFIFFQAPLFSGELTSIQARNISVSVNLLNPDKPGKYGKYLLENWDSVVKMTKHPDKFPEFMFSADQITALDKFKKNKFMELRQQFVEKLASEDPAFLKKIRGFMKTGSWAKPFNPSYVEVVSDFDMTVVGETLADELECSDRFYKFLKEKGFDVNKMDVTVFPVPKRLSSKAGEVFQGGAMKFVDVYNQTDGRFDSIGFNKNGDYTGIYLNNSPESSFSVVYDGNGRPVKVVSEFARFTASDAPDLMLTQEKKLFEELSEKMAYTAEISKDDVKKISKLLSRSAYGSKIMKKSPGYSDIERISFKIKWANADPDDLLADRIQEHLKKMGASEAEDDALALARKMAYREYFDQAAYRIKQNADEALEYTNFKSNFFNQMKKERPLYGKLLDNLDKAAYIGAVYNIYKAWTQAPDDKKIDHAVMTTAKEVLELKIPSLTWTNLSAAIVYSSLVKTAKTFYQASNDKTTQKMLENIFYDKDIVKMNPDQIRKTIEERFSDTFDNTEHIGGSNNLQTLWDKNQGNPKEIVYWKAITYKREMALENWKNRRESFKREADDYQRIIDFLKKREKENKKNQAQENQNNDGTLSENLESSGPGDSESVKGIEINPKVQGSNRDMEKLQQEKDLALKNEIQQVRERALALLEKKAENELGNESGSESGSEAENEIVHQPDFNPEEEILCPKDFQIPGFEEKIIKGNMVEIKDSLAIASELRCSFERDISNKKNHCCVYTNTLSLLSNRLKSENVPWIKEKIAENMMFKELFPEFKVCPDIRFEVYFPKKKIISKKKMFIGWNKTDSMVDKSFSGGLMALDSLRKDIDETIEKYNRNIKKLPEDLSKARKSLLESCIYNRARAQKGLDQLIRYEQAKFDYNTVRILGRADGEAGYADAHGSRGYVTVYKDYDLKCSNRVKIRSLNEKKKFQERMEYLKACKVKTNEIMPEYSVAEKEFSQRKRFLLASRKIDFAKLDSRKIKLLNELQLNRDKALKKLDTILSSGSKVKNPKKIGPRAKVLSDNSIVTAWLSDFTDTQKFILRYRMCYFPEYAQWKEKITDPLAFFEIEKQCHALSDMEDSVFVNLIIQGMEKPFYNFRLKLFDKQFDKHVSKRRSEWKKRVKRLNKKISAFLNNYTENKKRPVRTSANTNNSSKDIENLRALYVQDLNESPEKIYSRYGLASEYRKRVDITASILSETEISGMDRIQKLWEDLYDLAEDEIIRLCQKIDLSESTDSEENTFTPREKMLIAKGLTTPEAILKTRNTGDKGNGKSRGYSGNIAKAAIDLREILNRINSHAKQALTAMDYNYDCTRRLKKHLTNINKELLLMKSILKSIDSRKDLPSDLFSLLKKWSADNASSQKSFYAQAVKMRQTKIPTVPANMRNNKYGRKALKRVNKLINMKKAYLGSVEVLESNSKVSSEINRLIR